jgi:hypothetical protein
MRFAAAHESGDGPMPNKRKSLRMSAIETGLGLHRPRPRGPQAVIEPSWTHSQIQGDFFEGNVPLAASPPRTRDQRWGGHSRIAVFRIFIVPSRELSKCGTAPNVRSSRRTPHSHRTGSRAKLGSRDNPHNLGSSEQQRRLAASRRPRFPCRKYETWRD